MEQGSVFLAQFMTLSDGVEVNGETISVIVDGMANFRDTAIKILAENGIINPQAGEWYDQQAWLNSFKKISSTLHAVTLTYIGRKIPESANFPVELDGIEAALKSIDVAYHMNHRRNGEILFDSVTGKMKEGIGHYLYKRIAVNRAVMVCHNPYPCDFDRGIIDAVAFRHKPVGTTNVRVTHEAPDHCRKNGYDFCTYMVEW